MCITFLWFVYNVEKLFLYLYNNGGYVYKVVDNTIKVRPSTITLCIENKQGS